MNNDKQQSAVEWYIETSDTLYRQWLHGRIRLDVYTKMKEDAKEQAKEMELNQTTKFVFIQQFDHCVLERGDLSIQKITRKHLGRNIRKFNRRLIK